jgi:hypothetical protein
MKILEVHDPSALIEVTWEGMTTNFDVYLDADGRVLIDADNNDYKLKWQRTRCVVCGDQADVTMRGGEPACYTHRKELT